MFAIQKILLETAGVDVGPDYFGYCTKLTKWLPDCHMFTPKSLLKRGYNCDQAHERRVKKLIAKEYIRYTNSINLLKYSWEKVCEFNKSDVDTFDI